MEEVLIKSLIVVCFLCCAAILNELLQRENRVLHFWTLKKRRLDQCQQYLVFERSAKQVSVYDSVRVCLCTLVKQNEKVKKTGPGTTKI